MTPGVNVHPSTASLAPQVRGFTLVLPMEGCYEDLSGVLRQEEYDVHAEGFFFLLSSSFLLGPYICLLTCIYTFLFLQLVCSSGLPLNLL